MTHGRSVPARVVESRRTSESLAPVNQPAAKGRSAIFWILLATGASCATCTVLTLGLMGLGLLAGDDVKTASSGSTSTSTSGRLPTGNTPNLYPGSPGWLPSGRGVAIPDAQVVDGKPEGLWWHWQSSGASRMNAGLILFLPDGTRASNPRPGGGRLFDLEGQRAQPGSTGLGTFEVDDGKLIQHYDGDTSTDPFEETSEGFSLGPQKHMPLAPPTEDNLVGSWATPGGKFIFRSDGTFESGLVDVGSDYTLAGGSKGMWMLDGYLIQLQQTGGPSWITTIGMTGDDFMVMGTAIYNRK